MYIYTYNVYVYIYIYIYVYSAPQSTEKWRSLGWNKMSFTWGLLLILLFLLLY